MLRAYFHSEGPTQTKINTYNTPVKRVYMAVRIELTESIRQCMNELFFNI